MPEPFRGRSKYSPRCQSQTPPGENPAFLHPFHVFIFSMESQPELAPWERLFSAELRVCMCVCVWKGGVHKHSTGRVGCGLYLKGKSGNNQQILPQPSLTRGHRRAVS